MIMAKVILFYVILELLIRHYFYFEKKVNDHHKDIYLWNIFRFFYEKRNKKYFFFVTFYIFYESNIKTSLNIK